VDSLAPHNALDDDPVDVVLQMHSVEHDADSVGLVSPPLNEDSAGLAPTCAIVENNRIGNEEPLDAGPGPAKYRRKFYSDAQARNCCFEIADHAVLNVQRQAIDEIDSLRAAAEAIDHQAAQADDVARAAVHDDRSVIRRPGNACFTGTIVRDVDRFAYEELIDARVRPAKIAGRQHADLAARIGLVVRALERGAGMRKRAVVAVVAEVRDPAL